AFQILGQYNDGQTPFYALAKLGGQTMMRGYFEGRFRDYHYTAAQVEVRTPLWWRFDAAAFVGTGEVAHRLGEFSLRELKPSLGFGIRFTVIPEERLRLRLDWGFGAHDSGFYIAADEAF
ncbi:MAG: BamA/TamA family outer membrane protein, partial [Ignavibacteriales bacterium]|nr:BamA/TamA family outer membrane protein [Ignavibacteriales bacterium]